MPLQRRSPERSGAALSRAGPARRSPAGLAGLSRASPAGLPPAALPRAGLARLTPARLARLPRRLEGRTEVACLLDAYAEMLTAHQRDLLRLYYHDDLSLGDIAARVGVTRQAVFDSLRRSVAELHHLEARLRVLAERDRQARTRAAVSARLAAVEQEVDHLAAAGALDVGPLMRALRALREAL